MRRSAAIIDWLITRMPAFDISIGRPILPPFFPGYQPDGSRSTHAKNFATTLRSGFRPPAVMANLDIRRYRSAASPISLRTSRRAQSLACYRRHTNLECISPCCLQRHYGKSRKLCGGNETTGPKLLRNTAFGIEGTNYFTD